MKKVGYYFIYSLAWLVSLLPFRVLYLLSDLLYLLLRYVIPYRKKIVYDNLRHAFPEKTPEQIQTILRKFYAHFCDTLVESIKMTTVSSETMQSRIRFADEDMLWECYRQEKQLMILMGHYGNWEWLASLAKTPVPYHFMTVYKPLENKSFDHLMIRLRTRFGTEAVPMQRVFRNVAGKIRSKQYSIMCFIADQNPDGTSLRHWIPFFHREVPVLVGAEKIARHHGLTVGFLHLEKIKRGHYLAHVDWLAENAAECSENPEYLLTEHYIRKLEERIREKPEYWLWTHRRWKHKKNISSCI